MCNSEQTQEKKEEPKAVANELKQTATKTAEKDKAAVLKPKKSKGVPFYEDGKPCPTLD